MSIIVSNISKKYGEQLALNNVSFEVGDNQIVGFLGPNGAGKSTMMKILTCYLPPSGGNASVCGFDIHQNSLEVRKQIGYLPEHNPLYHDMYVKEFLGFVAGIYRMKNVPKKVAEMIELTGLEKEQNKKIAALSKGYKQRVGIAQAMIHDPKVLIMDEPTTGLDPNQLEEIRNLIKSLGQHKTVMLSTHIMQEVEAICNRVIIINKGEIVANDETKHLQSQSTRQIITVEFDQAIEVEALKQIPMVDFVVAIGPNKWQINSSTNTDIRKALFDFAIAKQITVLTLQKEEQSMESVFKSLTK